MKVLNPSLNKISAIRKERVRQGERIIDLISGEQDHSPPNELIKSLQQAINQQYYGFTILRGDFDTKRAIAAFLKYDNISVNENNLFLSSSARGITFLAIQTYVQQSDSVILSIPYYPPYPEQVYLSKGSLELVKSEDEMIDRIRSNKNIKMAIVTNPNNPDGKIYDNEFLMQLSEICDKQNAYLVVDEIYKDFWYKSLFESIASSRDFNSSNTIIVRSFSKSLGISGWRLAYSISSPKVASDLARTQYRTINAPNSLVQKVIADSLSGIDTSYFEENRKRYKNRLTALTELLRAEGIQADMPDGAFFLFLDLSGFIGKMYEDSSDFANTLAEKEGILVWPGKDYGNDSCVRISLSGLDYSDIPEVSEGIVGVLRR